MPSGETTAQAQKAEICKHLLWVLTSLLFIELIVAWYINRDSVSARQMQTAALSAIAIGTSLWISRFYKKRIDNLLYMALAAIAVYEILLGAMQILGMASSEHALYLLTGSFPNPNPYAGFLAVMFCIILSLVLSGKCKTPWLAWILRIILYALAILIPVTMCRSAIIALAVGSGFILFRYSLPVRRFIVKNGRWLLAASIVILVLMYFWKRDSANGRAFIYKVATLTMLSNGFRGVGLGHYQMAASQTQINYFKDRIAFSSGQFEIPDKILNESLLAGNPDFAFCDPLQLGVEAGAFTMITYICIILLTLFILYRSKSALFYGLLAVQVTSLVSYSMNLRFFQLFTAICIGCALCSTSTKFHALTLACKSVPGAIASAIILIALPFHRRSYNEWQEDRVFYESGAYNHYAECCSKLQKELDYSWAFLYEYGYALSQTGNLEKSDSILQCGAQRFGQNSFYFLLGENAAARHDYQKAQEYYWNAFCMSPHHLTPLYRLALMYNEQGNRESFTNMYKSIKDFNPKNDHEIKARILNELEQITQSL